MKQFDMRRFGLVLKLDFAEGIRPLLWNALLMVLVYLGFFWFSYNVSMKNINGVEDPVYVKGVCEAVGVFGCIAMYIYCVASAVRIFRDVQQKQKLTTYLMLPATNLEKFLSRWVYMMVFSIVGGLLAFFVADGLHAVWLLAMNRPVYWASGFFIEMFPYGTAKYWQTVVELYCMLVFVHAFYFCGSVLFKRYHFVATGTVGLLLLSGFSWLLRITGLYKQYADLTWETSATIDIAFTLVGIVLLTWLSYWLFCRYQVITRKLVNL